MRDFRTPLPPLPLRPHILPPPPPSFLCLLHGTTTTTTLSHLGPQFLSSPYSHFPPSCPSYSSEEGGREGNVLLFVSLPRPLQSIKKRRRKTEMGRRGRDSRGNSRSKRRLQTGEREGEGEMEEESGAKMGLFPPLLPGGGAPFLLSKSTSRKEKGEGGEERESTKGKNRCLLPHLLPPPFLPGKRWRRKGV